MLMKNTPPARSRWAVVSNMSSRTPASQAPHAAQQATQGAVNRRKRRLVKGDVDPPAYGLDKVAINGERGARRKGEAVQR